MLRKVIAVVVAAPALSACDLLRDPGPPPAPDALTDFYQQTRALAGHYDTLVATRPELAAIRGAHYAHLQALADVMRPAPSASATPSAPPPASPATPIKDLESAAHQEAVRVCLAAPSYRATLLAEIAAARACHVEVLSA
jgi:hypothetical protein